MSDPSAPRYSKVKKPAYDDRRRSEFLTPPVSVAILPRINLPRTRTLLSAILPEKVNDYLQVNISLPQISMAQDMTSALAKTTAHKQTPTTATATANATSERPSRATMRKTRKDPPAAPTSPTPQSRGIDALAQIDTGCEVGDVINRRVLRGEHRLRDSDSPMWICSGLDNKCIESKSVLDIVVSFKKDSLKYIFSLPVRIAEDSEIDLIIGIDTLKNLNLVKIMPKFFGHKNHTDPWTRIDNSMVLTTNNLPDTIPSTAVQEPPVNNDLDGEKPSNTDNLRQGDMVSGGACTHKNCTSTYGCSQIRVAAATDPVQDGSILQACERSITHLTSPRQDDLELTLESSYPNLPFHIWIRPNLAQNIWICRGST